eukprot:m.50617 g.50617  ORF g.50617 m.50617 type:complete len:382 (-) comp9021_c0_seq1:44-1189(-)
MAEPVPAPALTTMPPPIQPLSPSVDTPSSGGSSAPSQSFLHDGHAARGESAGLHHMATAAEGVIDALIAAANCKNIDRMVSLMAPGCVYVNDPVRRTCRGPTAVRAELEASLRSDLKATIEWVVLRQVARGNCVMNERVERIKREGGSWEELPLMGCFEVSSNGLITRWVDYWDSAKKEAQEKAAVKPRAPRRKFVDHDGSRTRCNVAGGCGSEFVPLKGRQGCHGPVSEIGYAHSSNAWDPTRGFCPFTETAKSLPLTNSKDVLGALEILKEKGGVPFRCWPLEIQRKYKALSAQKRRKKRKFEDQPPPPQPLFTPSDVSYHPGLEMPQVVTYGLPMVAHPGMQMPGIPLGVCVQPHRVLNEAESGPPQMVLDQPPSSST